MTGAHCKSGALLWMTNLIRFMTMVINDHGQTTAESQAGAEKGSWGNATMSSSSC
jgi:hypothetical protein